MKRRNRQHRSLNVSNSHWMAYAAAGLASASGGVAEGAIHYTDPANVALRGFDIEKFRLDDFGDKLVFVHRHYSPSPPEFFAAQFRVVARVSASVRASRIGGSFHFLSNLTSGSFVSQGYLRPGGFGTLAFYGGGYFGEPGIGFIGFAFNNGSGKQYGWARVEMGGEEHKNNFKVLDYAYADPGEPIKAGQRSEEPVTGMDSLGLLAAGAVGLTAWRKSRRSVSSVAP